MTESSIISAIQQFDTCTVLNAIETFHVRLRNEGFARPGLHWLCPSVRSVVGYASTMRIKSSNPPIRGTAFDDKSDWWKSMNESSAPRIAVVQDIDESIGVGSVAGEIHAAIMQRLGCVALVTNGSVRDIVGIEALGFACSAVSVSPSHAYGHMVNHGQRVEILGLHIEQDELLMADCHGLISIPMEIASEVATAAAEIQRKEKTILDFCKGPEFSIERLQEMVK